MYDNVTAETFAGASQYMLYNSMHYAILNNRLDHVQLIHECGADLTKDGVTWLNQAALEGHMDIIKYLHEQGVNPDDEKCEGLLWGAASGKLNIVKYFYPPDAKVTAQHLEAMGFAQGNGHLSVVKYLHERGVELNVDNGDGFKWAVWNNHLSVVEYMLKHVVYPVKFIYNLAYHSTCSDPQILDMLDKIVKDAKEAKLREENKRRAEEFAIYMQTRKESELNKELERLNNGI